MSKDFVEKIFKERLNSAYNRAISAVKGREDIQNIEGQLIDLFNVSDIKKAISNNLDEKIKLDDSVFEKAVEGGRKAAYSLEIVFKNSFPEKFEVLRNIAIKYHGKDKKVLGSSNYNRDYFLVEKFRERIRKSGEREYWVRGARDIYYAILEKIAEKYSDNFSVEGANKDIQKGHGPSGRAVAEAQIGLAGYTYNDIITELNKDPNKKANIKSISEFLNEAVASKIIKLEAKDIATLKHLATDYEQIVDVNTGSISANYLSVITFQDAIDNLKDSALEKKIKIAFFKDLVPYIEKELINLHGSSTIKEKATVAIMSKFAKIKYKDIVITSAVPLNTKLKTSGRAETKGKTARISSKTENVKAKGPTIKLNKIEARVKTPIVNLKTLIPILNQRLSDIVRANMGYPALVNRTGRFASSARVVDITQTPKGYPSVAYTYMRNPYGAYEYPGGSLKYKDQDRDPRPLIDKSIREAATGIMAGRFYTRRV